MSGVVGPSCQRQVRFGICRLETMVILDNDGEGRRYERLLNTLSCRVSPRFSSRVFGCGISGLGWIQLLFWGRSQPIHCLVAPLILGTE